MRHLHGRQRFAFRVAEDQLGTGDRRRIVAVLVEEGRDTHPRTEVELHKGVGALTIYGVLRARPVVE